MSVLSIVAFGAVFVAGAVVASIAHELTHALATYVAGGRVRQMSLLNKWVEYELPERSGPNSERFVLLAPQLAGVGIAVGLLSAFGTTLSIVTATLWFWWAVYAVWGSRQDYSLAAARSAATASETRSSPSQQT